MDFKGDIPRLLTITQKRRSLPGLSFGTEWNYSEERKCPSRGERETWSPCFGAENSFWFLEFRVLGSMSLAYVLTWRLGDSASHLACRAENVVHPRGAIGRRSEDLALGRDAKKGGGGLPRFILEQASCAASDSKYPTTFTCYRQVHTKYAGDVGQSYGSNQVRSKGAKVPCLGWLACG